MRAADVVQPGTIPECNSVLVECFHGVHVVVIVTDNLESCNKTFAWAAAFVYTARRLKDFTRMSIPPLLNLCIKVHRQLSIPDWVGKIPVDGHPTQHRWNPVTGKKAE